MAGPEIRRQLTIALTVGASVLGLCACGGPTDASVIARGNAICEQTLAAIRVVPPSGAGVSAAAVLVAKEARELRALPRPAEHRALLAEFIAAEQAFARAYQTLAAAERGEDRSGVAQSEAALATNHAAGLARRYGLSRCAAAGPTVGSG